MPATNWHQAVTAFATDKLTQQRRQITRCLRLLDDQQIWHRANAHCNSIGNLVLHLSGNVRQWINAGLGGQPFRRDRPAEFAERGPLPPDALLTRLTETVHAAAAVIGRLDAAALEQRYTIQGYEVTGVVALFHVVEHFSLHTGQIVHITKTFCDADLSLYDEQGRRHEGDGP